MSLNTVSLYSLSLFLRNTFLFFIILFVQTSSAQWQPDVRLTNDPGISNTSPNSSWNIKADGNFVHIIWYDNRNGNDEIYYKRSSNGGVSWGADTRLTNDIDRSGPPSLSVSGSYLHVMWTDYRDGNPEVYYKRSTDNGANWGGDVRLTNDPALSYSPSGEVSGSSVQVVWYDFRDGQEEIYYKRSTDGGTTWSTDTRLTNDPAISFIPSVTITGNIVNVFWTDSRDGNFEIYTKRSTDGGTNWGTDTRLTNDTLTSWFCTAAFNGLAGNLVWTDNRNGNNETYYKRSTDGGANWGADVRLTNNSADSYRPSVTVSGSDVHIVWTDNRDGNYEIYYKRSTDGGLSWGSDLRLTNGSGDSFNSTISASATTGLHVAWWDDRDGNHEVYYKRNLQNINLNLSMIEAGFYNSMTNRLNMKDTVRAYLRSPVIPFSIIDSAKTVIDSVTFSGSFIFSNAASGSYYITVKHRNSIETWSKNGGELIIRGDTASYNFTNDITKAYGNNMGQVSISPNRFGVYSGDVNQDGFIDLLDENIVFNDASSFVTGYKSSDVNGDNVTDLADISITFNNASNFVSIKRP